MIARHASACSTPPPALPEQLEAAARGRAPPSSGLPAHDDIANVVVLGMGGSGIAGDIVAVVAGPFMPVPVVVHKGYGIPNFIDATTLVFAISFSGDTEETVEAATEAALRDGAQVAVHQPRRRAWPSWPPTAGAPHVHRRRPASPCRGPRIGAVAVPPLRRRSSEVGLFPGAAGVDRRRGRAAPRRRDAADRRRQPGPPRWPGASAGRSRSSTAAAASGGLAAERWKTQFNENAKVPAFANAGARAHATTRSAAGASTATSPARCSSWSSCATTSSTRRSSRRFDLRRRAARRGRRRRSHRCAAEGDGPLAQLLDLVLFGDFVTPARRRRAGRRPGPGPGPRRHRSPHLGP